MTVVPAPCASEMRNLVLPEVESASQTAPNRIMRRFKRLQPYPLHPRQVLSPILVQQRRFPHAVGP